MPKKISNSIHFICWFFLIVFLPFSFLTTFVIRTHAADHHSGSLGKATTGFHAQSHGMPTSSHTGVNGSSPYISRETYPDHTPGGAYPRPNHRTFHPKQAGKLQSSASLGYEAVSAGGDYIYGSYQGETHSPFFYCREAVGHWEPMERGEIWIPGEIIPCD